MKKSPVSVFLSRFGPNLFLNWTQWTHWSEKRQFWFVVISELTHVKIFSPNNLILVFWSRFCCCVVITAPAICWRVGRYKLKLYGLKRFKLSEVWFNVFQTPTAEYRGGVYETIRSLRQEMLLLISDAESVGGNETCVLKDFSTLQIQLWIFYPRLSLWMEYT